jgi:hypothetical protein
MAMESILAWIPVIAAAFSAPRTASCANYVASGRYPQIAEERPLICARDPKQFQVSPIDRLVSSNPYRTPPAQATMYYSSRLGRTLWFRLAPSFALKAGSFSQHARRQPNQCQLSLGCPHNATDPLPRNPELPRDFGSRKGL